MEKILTTQKGHKFPKSINDSLEQYNSKTFDRQSVLHSRFAGIILTLSGLLFWLFFANYLFLLLLVPAFFCLAIIPWLFRSPRRNISHAQEVIAAPSDGVITEISTVTEPNDLTAKAIKFRIARSLFSVQIIRAPCSGQIIFVKQEHNPEKNKLFKIRFKPREHLESIFLQEEYNKQIVVKQSASHRIISRIRHGDYVNCGNIIGMTNFNSIIDIFIPVNGSTLFEVKARKGQRTVAGITTLGSWKKDNGC